MTNKRFEEYRHQIVEAVQDYSPVEPILRAFMAEVVEECAAAVWNVQMDPDSKDACLAKIRTLKEPQNDPQT